MASIFGHAVSAYALSKLFPDRVMEKKVVMIGMASAMLPDLDVISKYFGVARGTLFAHRGITHSIAFALIWALIVLLIWHRGKIEMDKWKLGFYYFLATCSHGILDALTTGGRGIAFFAPFFEDRYFLPWRIIQVSPLGVKNFFSSWGIAVLKNEAIFILIPSLIVIGIGMLLNRMIYPKTSFE